ncbi:hypothetical protein L484_011383 [Morus notabilis]|uniref:Uncharacterized protein n=1 Tax=Morus notabilis TaxID=981085 RepID=W9R7S7_9ROSA|nr:hypothetical protein L484_011383 [Morus notabilis]
MDGLIAVGVCLIFLVVKNSSAYGDGGETTNAADLKSEKSLQTMLHMRIKEMFPHMTAFDDSLIVVALQYDYVPLSD